MTPAFVAATGDGCRWQRNQRVAPILLVSVANAIPPLETRRLGCRWGDRGRRRHRVLFSQNAVQRLLERLVVFIDRPNIALIPHLRGTCIGVGCGF